MNNAEQETLLKFYETARQEILVRISARDNSLLIYLGAIAAIIGTSFQTNQTLFLLIIPYLALGISLIISNHHAIISALAIYCSTELGEIFYRNGILIPQWDNSSLRSKYSNRTFITRYWGDAIMINIPSIIAIITAIVTNKLNSNLFVIYVISCICFSISILILVFTFYHRKKLYREKHQMLDNIVESLKNPDSINS